MAAGDRLFWSDIDEAIARPAGRLVQTVAQTGIVTATVVAATFTTEDLDSHNYHSTSVNTSRVTPLAPVPAWYEVKGGIAFAGATDYVVVEAFLRLNGGGGLAPAHRITPSAQSQTLVLPVACKIPCNGTTDYFEICLRASKTAGTISTVISSQFACALEWSWDRPL